MNLTEATAAANTLVESGGTMKLRIGDDRACLFVGDSADAHTLFHPGSVDSLVTDPPAGIGFMGRDWDSDKGGRDQWIEWLAGVLRGAHTLLKPGGHALVWALPRTAHWTMTALEDAGFEVRDVVSHMFGTGFPKSLDVSKAIDKAAGVATPEAAEWEGWGTALKPAAEFWILARKPLTGTVTANVLEHGTGALNIDGCRIERDPADVSGWSSTGSKAGANIAMSGANTARSPKPDAAGRWPANVVLSHTDACFEIEPDRFACVPGCAVRDLDDQAKTKGCASRFFYTAKVSRAERDHGCEHLEHRSGARNHHPTVKPQALMRWLVRLITPPGGTVLDLFAGSGSTAVAALSEGCRFVGVELSDEYAEIAAARITQALKDYPPTTKAGLNLKDLT